jgi:hypothetical protein
MMAPARLHAGAASRRSMDNEVRDDSGRPARAQKSFHTLNISA